MSFDDMIGVGIPDVDKVNCRDCKYAMKGKILNGICEKFPNRKPKDVYHFYAKCPEYEKGEDLLKYEL